MRILHVFKTYLPDTFAGIERVIWQIAEGCADLGIESEVLSLSKNPDENSIWVDRHQAIKSRELLNVASTGISLDFIDALRQRAKSVDIVHYHFPWPMMDLAHLIARPARPTVLTYHSDIVRQRRLETLYVPLRKTFLDRIDRIVATSPPYLETSPVLARYRSKTSVIPIGLDPLRLARTNASLLESWRTRVGPRFFLFVGALRYYKGVTFLIEAARLSGLPIVIVGEGEMGDDIVRAGLDTITMVGAVNDADKAALLELCTAFVFPSHLRSEAFGVALLEAAFAGKPMISCELGTGTSYVNVNGETGIVVQPADPGALAKAMTRIWEDGAVAARYGERSAQRANALFTAKDMTKGYVDIYRGLTERSSGSSELE